MSDSELIYELEADPPAAEKFFAALQHVLASFVGIITPTLIIGGALGLGESCTLPHQYGIDGFWSRYDYPSEKANEHWSRYDLYSRHELCFFEFRSGSRFFG